MEVLIATASLTNPWIWVSVFILLMVAEAMIENFFFLGGAVASIIVAGFVAYLGPDVEQSALLIVFCVAVVSWIVCTLALQRKFAGGNRVEAQGDSNGD